MNTIHWISTSWDYQKKKTGRLSSRIFLFWTKQNFNLEEPSISGHLQGKKSLPRMIKTQRKEFNIISLRVINGTHFESNAILHHYNDSTFKIWNLDSYLDLGSIFIFCLITIHIRKSKLIPNPRSTIPYPHVDQHYGP